MKPLQSSILTVAFMFSGFLINAQDKAKDFEFKELKPEKTVHSEFDKNYSSGIEHYNAAIKQLAGKSEFATLEELEALQKSTQDQIKLALPYFEKAYKINSKDRNVLEGLAGCYFSLNDNANYEKYKKALHELGK
jgi:tetratricopeptide (TPR) repeat protein